MKKNILLALATVAALALGLGAQDISVADGPPKAEQASVTFDQLYNGGSGLIADPADVSAPVAADPAQATAAASAAEREWLVMVFINGRNNLAPAAIADVNEMETVGSTDKVAVTAELGLINDRGTSARFLVQKDTMFPVVNLVRGDADLTHIISNGIKVPNADMGSWRHFADFAKWSIRRYPAKKVMAVLWNHGSGRIDIGGADNSGSELGIAYDDTTRNFIRNKQIAMALAEIRRSTGKKVDVYASDACLMQMASVAYEIKDDADFIVGAEETVPGSGFPYDTILSGLAAAPETDAEGLSKIIVDKFYAYYNGSGKNTTISAIRSSELPGFAAVINEWVKAAATAANRTTLLEAEQNALSFEDGYDGNDTFWSARSKDLYDFIDLANEKADKASEVYAKGEALKAYLANSLVIANKTTKAGSEYDRAKGIAVYFPRLIYDSSYDENVFSRDSLWDDFLKWKLDPSYEIR